LGCFEEGFEGVDNAHVYSLRLLVR
jgi:hypothetical protein